MRADPDRFVMSARADPAHAGRRLDQVAAMLFPDFSRGRLQKWIRSGELTVDGRARKTTHRLDGSELLSIDAEIEAAGAVVPQDIPLEIIHADDDLLLVNKPAGLVVHPAAGNPDGTLQNALLYHDERLDALPRSGIVHRLDKDTSGIMVVARTLRAHTRLVEQLQSRTMSRVYRALATGQVVAGGSVDAPIGRHPRNRKKMAVVSSGRAAVSHYRVLQSLGDITYLEVSLETGRTHQIRVHMAHIGHSLVGDPVYGRPMKTGPGMEAVTIEAIRAFPRQALHACTLTLLHPATSEKVSFRAPLPGDFTSLLAVLRGERP
jgi:23S rRNA pseudouridine1911/1915/1917 synthase